MRCKSQAGDQTRSVLSKVLMLERSAQSRGAPVHIGEAVAQNPTFLHSTVTEFGFLGTRSIQAWLEIWAGVGRSTFGQSERGGRFCVHDPLDSRYRSHPSHDTALPASELPSKNDLVVDVTALTGPSCKLSTLGQERS